MASDEASRLTHSLFKVNFYAALLAAATAAATDLLTGLLSFVVWLHIFAALPYIFDLESFSEKEILKKALKRL